MKKTVILASAVALLVSCNSDGSKKKEVANSDIVGHTLSLASHAIKLDAKYAGDNELRFTDSKFQLIEIGELRNCTGTDAKYATIKDQPLAEGTWELNAKKKELDLTFTEVKHYALPFANNVNAKITITDLGKDKAGDTYGKIAKLYDQSAACKAVDAGQNTKEIKGTKLHFTSTTNDQVSKILEESDLNTPDGASYVASFKDKDGKNITLKAGYAADNLLSFVPKSTKLTYVEAGTTSRDCGAGDAKTTEKGDHLAGAAADLVDVAASKTPTYTVNEKGDLTVTISKVNTVRYLLPFAVVEKSPSEDISFTIKNCELQGNGDIVGTIENLYDLEDDKGTKTCVDLTDGSKTTSYEKVTVTLKKQSAYDQGKVAVDAAFLLKNFGTFKIASFKKGGTGDNLFKAVSDVNTAGPGFPAGVLDNTITLTKDGNNLKFTYNEGKTPYMNSCAGTGSSATTQTITNTATQLLAKGSVTLAANGADKVDVTFTTVDLATAATSPAINYFIPYGDGFAAGKTIKLSFPSEVYLPSLEGKITVTTTAKFYGLKSKAVCTKATGTANSLVGTTDIADLSDNKGGTLVLEYVKP